MASLVALRSLALAVLAAGLLVGGLGAYQAVTDDCRSGHGVSLDRLADGETPESSYRTVAYGNLTDREQSVFVESLGDPRVYEDEPAVRELNGKVVTYRGDRYEAVLFVGDCAEPWVGLLLGGGLASVAGAAVAGGAHARIR